MLLPATPLVSRVREIRMHGLEGAPDFSRFHLVAEE